MKQVGQSKKSLLKQQTSSSKAQVLHLSPSSKQEISSQCARAIRNGQQTNFPHRGKQPGYQDIWCFLLMSGSLPHHFS